MRSVLAALRIASAFVLGLAVLATAQGWLYLLRSHAFVGGPRVGDALPLDELPRHAGVPLLLFFAVWAVAAFLLGLLARWSRAERLTASLLLALAVGGWAYATTGISLLVVRQVPAEDAFHAANGLRAVWLPALLAGSAGALLGRQHKATRPRAPFVLAVFVGTAGLVGVLAAILPVHGESLIRRFAPMQVHPVAHALVAPIALALVFVARGLAKRKHRAWQVALALLAPLAVLHLLHGYGAPAVVTTLTALALIARRKDFDAYGDPASRPRLLAGASVAIFAVYAYGAAALWTNRLMADRPFTVHFALRETTRALFGLDIRGSARLAGSFAIWFPLSVFLIGAGAAAWLLSRWLAPWRFRHRQGARERELARALVSAWGVDTLAPFTLRADKSYFFSADESAFLAYRVVGGVAIVSGDPIGRLEQFDELIARFIEFARRRDWRIAILGASEARLDLYCRHGLRSLYHGDEAVVDTRTFSLDGRLIRKVRQSQHRLARAGYHSAVLDPRAIAPELRAELEQIATTWRGSEPERGFVMALDALFHVDDSVFVVGFAPDGTPKGFLHFALSRAGSALSLSSMPRLADTPNGFNEWLVCDAIAWARDNGFARVSLNFAPFAALLAPEATLTRRQEVEKRVLLSMKGRFQLDNLLHFNRKFFPEWERRFVVYERRIDLPRVGIAALAAESYLPFSGKRE
ncbi:MAG: bifunctional lysylphosphatidylglycerol flippase/synthetase MprF [Gaiellaceae bacterium]